MIFLQLVAIYFFLFDLRSSSNFPLMRFVMLIPHLQRLPITNSHAAASGLMPRSEPGRHNEPRFTGFAVGKSDALPATRCVLITSLHLHEHRRLKHKPIQTHLCPSAEKQQQKKPFIILFPRHANGQLFLIFYPNLGRILEANIDENLLFISVKERVFTSAAAAAVE